MTKLYAVIRSLSKKIVVLSMIGLVFGMLFAVVECTLRLVFRHSIVGGYELTQVVFSVIVFGALVYTQSERGHINVVIFIKKLNRRVRFIIFTITSFLSAVVCGAVAVSAIRQIFEAAAAGYASAQLDIPFWPFYAYEGIMLVLFTIILVIDTVQSAMAIGSSKVADEIMSTWD